MRYINGNTVFPLRLLVILQLMILWGYCLRVAETQSGHLLRSAARTYIAHQINLLILTGKAPYLTHPLFYYSNIIMCQLLGELSISKPQSVVCVIIHT